MSVLRTVYVPKEPRVLAACCTSSFCRSAQKKKKKKHLKLFAFFFIVQSNEWRGGPSVVSTKVYRCLECPETEMEEKYLVSFAG